MARPEQPVSPKVLSSAFEPDGTIANDTLCLRAPTIHRHGTVPEWLAAEEALRVHGEEVVWGGQIFNHYGHFLCESVSRLWPLLPGGSLAGAPVAFVPEPGEGRGPEPPFVGEWLDAFGVERLELPERGTIRFAKMAVPEPAWRINAWMAAEMREIHLHARQGMELPARPPEDVIWLSRSDLNHYRVPYDESLLVWLLADHVTVVRPETMSLVEQVAAFEASRAVVGVIGSAFHTVLMTEQPPDCLYLCPPWDKSSYPAQQRLIDARADFAQALAIVAPTRQARERGLAFPYGFRLLIPETLRALAATVLPGLLDDPRLASFAEPARHWPSAVDRRSEGDVDTAVARVLLNPESVEARRDLEAAFKAEGLADCSGEQRAIVRDLTEEPEYARRQDGDR